MGSGDALLAMTAAARPPPRKTKTRRKRRTELLLGQMCFLGALLVAAAGLSSLAGRAGYSTSTRTADDHFQRGSRRLLQEPWTNTTEERDRLKNCTEPGRVLAWLYFAHKGGQGRMGLPPVSKLSSVV
ncbi:sodium/potassium/calcium exchanger 3 [Arapaima gigas]